MGDHGLRMMLRQAGMDRYLEQLPPDNSRAGPKSAEYSHVLATVRRYFGRGARGTLFRIGREAFRQQLTNRRNLALAKRTVLVLHDLMEVPAEEIASTLNAPVPTVRSRLFYARRELARALKHVRERSKGVKP